MTATGAIACVKAGVRVIMNTNWPVELVLRRGKGGRGYVVATVCNGMAEGIQTFPTEAAARAYMAERGEVVDL